MAPPGLALLFRDAMLALGAMPITAAIIVVFFKAVLITEHRLSTLR